MSDEWEKYREKIIGLGESSSRKSYYPELQEKIRELEASQTNLQTILDSTSDGIVIHDKEGRILSLNKQARKIFNINESEEYKYTVFDVSSSTQNKNELYPIWDEVLQGKPKVIEWIVCQIRTKNEVFVQVSINRTNWYGELALVAVLRDFTERKKYENELLIAKKKAEDSDRLKSAFLANLSHEIRTPMNAILGFSELLKTANLPSFKRDNFIDIINKSGNHLLSIISDIVEISKIETNQVALHLKPVKVNSLIDELYEVFKVMLSDKSEVDLRVKKQIKTSDIEIVTDQVKLRQILINLISNSFKYTNQGDIEFGYEISETINFFVRDTGVGIDKKYHQVIFERFRQIESDLTIQKGGSGLGLAICKAYVEMLGGSIMLESELGKGSMFMFSIPLVIPTNDKVDSSSAQKDEMLNVAEPSVILVVEDDEVNYLYLSELFSQSQFRLKRACNGKEAIAVLSANNDIQLVLMDIKMPVMNGYDALKVIRQMNPDLPVIAQTAYALPDDDTRIKEAGFNGYITKPIVRDRLFGLIKQVLENR